MRSKFLELDKRDKSIFKKRNVERGGWDANTNQWEKNIFKITYLSKNCGERIVLFYKIKNFFNIHPIVAETRSNAFKDRKENSPN